MPAKGIFGTVIASVLLVLYVILVGAAVWSVFCSPSATCRPAFTEEMGSALSLLGGLVAAPVIAALAVTEANETPGQRILGFDKPSTAPRWLKTLVATYFVFWMLTGVTALFIGWRFPEDAGVLSNLGKTWLGLAVAAGYAYFGVTPPSTDRTQAGA